MLGQKKNCLVSGNQLGENVFITYPPTKKTQKEKAKQIKKPQKNKRNQQRKEETKFCC